MQTFTKTILFASHHGRYTRHREIITCHILILNNFFMMWLRYSNTIGWDEIKYSRCFHLRIRNRMQENELCVFQLISTRSFPCCYITKRKFSRNLHQHNHEQLINMFHILRSTYLKILYSVWVFCLEFYCINVSLILNARQRTGCH